MKVIQPCLTVFDREQQHPNVLCYDCSGEGCNTCVDRSGWVPTTPPDDPLAPCDRYCTCKLDPILMKRRNHYLRKQLWNRT